MGRFLGRLTLTFGESGFQRELGLGYESEAVRSVPRERVLVTGWSRRDQAFRSSRTSP